MFIDRGMDKEDVVHILKRLFFGYKYKIKPFAATKMVLGDWHTKSDREREI